MHPYRSHTCADLTRDHVGDEVRLSGWVHRIRDHGGILFIDLRDHYGVTQLLCDPDSPAFAGVERLRAETCIRIDGRVKARAADLVNPKLPTGEIEVFVQAVEVLGPTEELPLQVFGDQDYPEETRLRYRFLDLRRQGLHDNMMLRSRVVQSMRRRMWDAGFNEFQTPIITASSPEGARDFLVPSRLHPGKFYALPQAPQQFKQLLMVSGFDKYFQIAPCFRDEDPRADRSPTDFYQLDVEMSFVTQDDVFAAVQPVIQGVFEEFKGEAEKRRGLSAGSITVDADWPQISHADAALWYGTDKPDLRCPIKMQDVTEQFRGSEFKIFSDLLSKDESITIRAIPAPQKRPAHGSLSNRFLNKIRDFGISEGLGGLAYLVHGGELFHEESNMPISEFQFDKAYFQMGQKQHAERIYDFAERLKANGVPNDVAQRRAKREADEFLREEEAQKLKGFSWRGEYRGPIANAIGQEKCAELFLSLGLKPGDAVFFAAGRASETERVLSKVRMHIGKELDLIDEDRFAFAWIVDFPMYEKDDEGRIDFSHNPFSMPQGGLEALQGDPLKVHAFQYDLACNGYEILSGGIRNHRPDVMFKAFEIAGYPASEVEARFGGMVNAFRYGAPPHGGCAAGIDRIVMLLADESNIREVILFPMNQRAEDLMMNAPSLPTNEQLRDLGLRVVPKEA